MDTDCSTGLFVFFPFTSTREEERNDDQGDNAENDLQRQAHLDVIHEGVVSRAHHHRIGRRTNWRGEAAGSGHGSRHHKGRWVDTDAFGSGPGDGRHEDGGGGITDEGGEQRSHDVNARHNGDGAHRLEGGNETFGYHL